jgi:hypothetical protein
MYIAAFTKYEHCSCYHSFPLPWKQNLDISLVLHYTTKYKYMLDKPNIIKQRKRILIPGMAATRKDLLP